MKKIKYKRIELNIPAGQNTSVEKELRLPSGICTAMAVLNSDRDNEPTQFVDLKVTENGADVIEPMDYRFSEKTIHGSHMDSWKQVHFDCGRTVDVQLVSKTNLVNELNLQVSFLIILK